MIGLYMTLCVFSLVMVPDMVLVLIGGWCIQEIMVLLLYKLWTLGGEGRVVVVQ